MVQVSAEFIVEPFTEGVLGPHVHAALDVLRAAGLEPDVGPFGNTVTGDSAAIFPSLSAASAAAFASGATAMEVTVRRVAPSSGDTEEFLEAMEAVARAVGGRVVALEERSPDDTPLLWRGVAVGALRIPSASPAPPGIGDLRRGIDVLVAEVEGMLGGPLLTLSRADKQRAVRLLDERGAFSIRNAVDEVADAIGVSRVTVYNYLKVTRTTPASREVTARDEPRANGKDPTAEGTVRRRDTPRGRGAPRSGRRLLERSTAQENRRTGAANERSGTSDAAPALENRSARPRTGEAKRAKPTVR